LGVVQCYGVAARHAVLETARRLAAGAMATLMGVFTAQFPQSRMLPLSGDRARWLFDALHNMPHTTALVGSPDPREAPRGAEQQLQPRHQATPQFTEQQNELLFRALSRAHEEFCFINIATPVPRSAIGEMLVALGNLASPIASRQQGMTSIGFGVSLPLIVSVGEAQTAGQAYGTSELQGQSSSVAQTVGKAHTDGQAQTSGWSYTQGFAHTEGRAETNSVLHSSGVTHSTSVNDATSQSHGSAHTDGAAQSHGVANTSGGSQSHGVSNSTAHTDGAMQSASQSQNWGVAVPI